MDIHNIHRSQGKNLIELKGGEPHQFSQAAAGVSVQNQQCYLDMGIFYGKNVLTQCMNWQNNTVSSEKLQSGFLGQFFSQMKSTGVKKIDLSFAQLSSITALAQDGQKAGSSSPSSYSANDSIGTIFHPCYPVEDGSGHQLASNFLSYLITQAHQNGIQVDLSLGGLKTCGTDAKLPKDPTSSAKDLAEFMKTMDIDSADFDIENSSIFTQNNPDDVSTFFSSLHQNLSMLGKQSTLTVEGGSLNEASYAPLMDNFNEKFDSVNLMLYSNTQYTLNPRPNNIWPGIEGWIDKVGDPSKVHVGFYDKIDYRNQASNQDGGDFHPNASTNGAAAGQIYQQMIKMLQEDGKLKPGQSLGDPFFWTDQPGSSSSIEFMQDFNNQLKGIKKNPWS